MNDTVISYTNTAMATSEAPHHPDTPIDLSAVQQSIDEVFASLSLPSSHPHRRAICNDSMQTNTADDDCICTGVTFQQRVSDKGMCSQVDDECVYVYAHTAIEIKVLLWNIHGNSSEGMAAARKILVGEVVRKCNPHILLLQEVEARRTVEHIRAESKLSSYSFYHSHKPTEAYIVYDTRCFEFVKRIELPSVIGDAKLLPGGVATRTGGNASQDFYNSRSCAIRLRHCHTRKELVLMSFHNASSRTGGRKPNIVSYAKGFLDLVCLVHRHEGVPVIAGGDFNCDRSALLEYARGLRCELPDYDKSKRRKLCEKIDFYVLKSSMSINSTVEVYEALPLADPTSASAHDHPMGRESIRYLVENAPVRRSGRRITRNDYTNTTNHDSTLNTVTVHYPEK